MEWVFIKAKVALAVAIIKSKPQGMSGREYAEALAGKLRSQDESWKKKAQGLQQEVLRLRQEMLITRVTSNTKSSTENTGRPLTMCQVIKNRITNSHLHGNSSNTLVSVANVCLLNVSPLRSFRIIHSVTCRVADRRSH